MSNQIVAYNENKTLYITNIPLHITEEQLFKHISRDKYSVKIIHISKKVSMYDTSIAYVTMNSHDEAEEVISKLDGLPIASTDNPLSIMWCIKDVSIRNSSEGNLYVKGIKRDVNQHTIYEIFSGYGKILSCKLSTNSNNQSNGHAYVKFENVDILETVITDEVIDIIKKEIGEDNFLIEKYNKPQKSESSDVYVDNIDEKCTEEDFKNYFSQFGTIKKDQQQVKHWFFHKKAISESDGKAIIGDSVVHSCFYLSKKQRQAELQRKNNEIKHNITTRYKDSNLYIKTNPPFTEAKIREKLGEGKGDNHFYSVKAQRVNGRLTGVAYVCFYTKEAADEAINKCQEMGWEAYSFKPREERSFSYYQQKVMLPYLQVMMQMPFILDSSSQMIPQPFNGYQQVSELKNGNKKNPKKRLKYSLGEDTKLDHAKSCEEVQQHDETRQLVIDKNKVTDEMRNDLGNELYEHVENMGTYDDELVARITGVLLESFDYNDLVDKLKSPVQLLNPVISEIVDTLNNVGQSN
ncbi:Polyadenylate-binding protein [Entamoeba marina]